VTKEEEKFICSCPLCKAVAAAQKSKTVKHFRGIEREMLLAARGLIDFCVERLAEPEEKAEEEEDE
jgi:hypothetical protein